jgi:hypothetical protein
MKGFDFHVDFLDEVSSDSKIRKDACDLHGILFCSCHDSLGGKILMKNTS